VIPILKVAHVFTHEREEKKLSRCHKIFIPVLALKPSSGEQLPVNLQKRSNNDKKQILAP